MPTTTRASSKKATTGSGSGVSQQPVAATSSTTGRPSGVKKRTKMRTEAPAKSGTKKPPINRKSKRSKAGANANSNDRAASAEQASVADAADTEDHDEATGNDNEAFPSRTSLMGLPVELRTLILRELLTSSEPFLDIPESLREDNTLQRPHKGFGRNADWLDPNRKFGPQWGNSERRLALTPQVLLACRQLHQEGSPLLYENATIGACIAMNFQHMLHPYSYAHKSYCMGQAGVRAALHRYPGLRSVSRWQYRIYVGAGDESDYSDDWYKENLNDDIDALWGINGGHLRYLHLWIINSTDDGFHNWTRPRQIAAPFHIFQCERFELTERAAPPGPHAWNYANTLALPDALRQELSRYTYLIPTRPLQEVFDRLNAIHERYRDKFRRCPTCHPAEGKHGLRLAPGGALVHPVQWMPNTAAVVNLHQSALPTAIEDIDVDVFYNGIKTYARLVQTGAIPDIVQACGHPRKVTSGWGLGITGSS